MTTFTGKTPNISVNIIKNDADLEELKKKILTPLIDGKLNKFLGPTEHCFIPRSVAYSAQYVIKNNSLHRVYHDTFYEPDVIANIGDYEIQSENGRFCVTPAHNKNVLQGNFDSLPDELMKPFYVVKSNE